MKHLLTLTSLALTFALPAMAEDRDSDGDVVSVLPYPGYARDSDGNVLSVLPYPEIFRDSDGNVISVIYPADYFRDSDGNIISVISIDDIYAYAADDSGVLESTGNPIPVADTPNTTSERPSLISVDGLIYKVAAPSDIAFLKTLERVNPTEFALD